MSDFKNKLKMFELNNIPPPPRKPKPFRTQSDPHVKEFRSEEIKVEPTKVMNNIDQEDNNSFGVNLTDESMVNDRESRGSVSTEEYTEDDNYNFFDSIYDLPGLENFLSVEMSTNSFVKVSEPPVILEELSKECYNNDEPSPNPIDSHTFRDENLLKPNDILEERTDDTFVSRTISPSPKLIEEIFNTTLWRNSSNFSDDFFLTPTENITNKDVESSRSSSQYLEDPKKSQMGTRRSLFSNIFRSKKGTKKSSDKTCVQDNTDTESVKNSVDKSKSQNKKNLEEDNKSLENTPKKPLNAIFNRDWLNTIGDGVKKKASVMSELRKVFSHGKFKHFKKKQPKNVAAVNTENQNNNNLYIEEDIYDCDSDHSIDTNTNDLQSKDEFSNINLKKKSGRVTIENKENKLRIRNSKIDSIYDDEEVEEEKNLDKDPVISNEGKILKLENQQSLYDDDNELHEVYASDEEVKKMNPLFSTVIIKTLSAIESIYDDGNESQENETEENICKNDNTKKSKSKDIVEEKKSNMFTNIFGKQLPKSVPHVSNISEKDNLSGKNHCHNDKKVNDKNLRSEKDKNIIKDVYDEDEDVENVEELYDDVKEENKPIDEEAKHRNNNVIPRKIENKVYVSNNLKEKSEFLSKILFKKSELYDEDEEISEEYVTDIKHLPPIKEGVKELSKKLKKPNNKEEKNNISQTNNLLSNKVEKKEKLNMKNSKEMKKSSKLNKKSKVNDDKCKDNILSRKVPKSLSLYDEDDIIVEEYAIDTEDEESEKKEKMNKRNLKVNTPKETKQKPETKNLEKNNKDNKHPSVAKTSELYDDDLDMEDVYITGEDVELPLPEINDLKKVENQKRAKEDIKNEMIKCLEKQNLNKNKALYNTKSYTGEKEVVRKNDIEEHGLNKNEDIVEEIYDDDGNSEIKEINKEGDASLERKITQVEQSKPSFITKLNEGIKRRQRNMIINLQNTSFIGNKANKKVTKPKPIKTNDGNNSMKDNVSNVSETSLENEDEILRNIKKKNMELAKELFKLKEPIVSIETARAMKTIYVSNEKYMQFNIGEFLDVLEYRNDLVLVMNGVGKCGLTSSSNIQLIKDPL